MIEIPRIVSIVEGRGESEQHAVPILVRRVAEAVGVYIDCYQTVRASRDRFPRFRDDRERVVVRAREKVGGHGGILIVLDTDGEPPCINRSHRSSTCVLGSELADDVRPMAAELPIAVVMAGREFEAWFLAAAESLVGDKGLRDGVTNHPTPDAVVDPKGWLSERMREATKYRPSADQARFTERFDMAMARERSPSFARAYAEIARLVQAVSHRPPTP